MGLRRRLTEAKLRNLLQRELRKRPQALYEISRNLGTSERVTLRHLEWLESVGKAAKVKHYYGGRIFELWTVPKDIPKKLLADHEKRISKLEEETRK